MDLTDFISKNMQTVYGSKGTIKEDVTIVIDNADTLANVYSVNSNINSTDTIIKNESVEIGFDNEISTDLIYNSVAPENTNINEISSLKTADALYLKNKKEQGLNNGIIPKIISSDTIETITNNINPTKNSDRSKTIPTYLNPTDTVIKDESIEVGYSERISIDSIINPITPVNTNINETDSFLKTEIIDETIPTTTTALINKDKTIPKIINPSDSKLKDETVKTGFVGIVDPDTGVASSVRPEDVNVIRYLTPTSLTERNIYNTNLKTGLLKDKLTDKYTTVESIPKNPNQTINILPADNQNINPADHILKDEINKLDESGFLEINVPNNDPSVLQQIVSGASVASIGNTLMKEANTTLSNMTGGLFGKNDDYGHPVQNSTEIQNAKANITKGIDYLLDNSKAYLAGNYVAGLGNQAKGFTSAGGLGGALQNVGTGLSIASTIAASLVNALTQYQYWTADEYANIINVNSNDLSVGDGNKEMTIKAFDKGNLVGREFEPEDGFNTPISMLIPSKKNDGKWESKLDSPKNTYLSVAKDKGSDYNSYEVETSNTNYIKNLRTNNFYSNQDENTGQWSKISGEGTTLSIENIRDASNTYAYKINNDNGLFDNNLNSQIEQMVFKKQQIGFIYVNPVAINGASPFKIPFEFNPILTEGSIEARYSAVSLLSRIGELRSYIGTNALTVSFKTQYLITDGVKNKPSDDNKPAPSGYLENNSVAEKFIGQNYDGLTNNWMDQYTEDYITNLEVAYRSLILPNFSSSDNSLNYARPPTVKIILSTNQEDNGMNPDGGAYELAYPFLSAGGDNSLNSNPETDTGPNHYSNNNILASQFTGNGAPFRYHKTFVVSSLTISKTFESQNAYYDTSGVLRFDGFTVDMTLVETTQTYTDALPDYNIYAQRFGNNFGSIGG